MLTIKGALYGLTLASALFFAFWEMKLKDQLLADAELPFENASDVAVFGSLVKSLRRQNFIDTLPYEKRRRLRTVVWLKLLSALLLVTEVLVLQR